MGQDQPGFLQLHPTGSGTVRPSSPRRCRTTSTGWARCRRRGPTPRQAQAIGRTFAQKKVAPRWRAPAPTTSSAACPTSRTSGGDKEYGSLGQRWVAAVDATAPQGRDLRGRVDRRCTRRPGGPHREQRDGVGRCPLSAVGARTRLTTGGNPNAMWSRTTTAPSSAPGSGVGEVTSIQVLGTGRCRVDSTRRRSD